MAIVVKDIMKARVVCVTSGTTLPELDRRFIAHHVSGFPVVDDGRLLGMVSHFDVVRRFVVEHAQAEVLVGAYGDEVGEHVLQGELDEIAGCVGLRMDHLCVRDIMNPIVISVSPGDLVEKAARLLVEHHIHRVPVVDGQRLVGIVSSLDLVRLLGEGRATLG